MKPLLPITGVALLALILGFAELCLAMPKPPTPIQNADPAVAVFAGGCFWCMEPPFDQVDGVIATRVGYTGGKTLAPTYKQVSAGGTGHFEAIEVTYNPVVIGYGQLLQIFWRSIDPLDHRGQFCDKGTPYLSAIFVADERERKLADSSRKEIIQQLRIQMRLEPEAPLTIATEILPLQKFFAAEDYHQDYYKNNPTRYQYYRWRCGRDQRLQLLWGNQNK